MSRMLTRPNWPGSVTGIEGAGVSPTRATVKGCLAGALRVVVLRVVFAVDFLRVRVAVAVEAADLPDLAVAAGMASEISEGALLVRLEALFFDVAIENIVERWRHSARFLVDNS